MKSSKNFVNTFSMLDGGWLLRKCGGNALPVVTYVASAYEYFGLVPGAGIVGHEVNLLVVFAEWWVALVAAVVDCCVLNIGTNSDWDLGGELKPLTTEHL